MRVVLALDDPSLARLPTSVEPVTPVSVHALASAQAQLAEAADRHAGAAQLYHDAAERWRQFGNIPERAYALLGEGRCPAALRDSRGEEPLCEAHELFASMGYKPAVAETEALLAQDETAAL